MAQATGSNGGARVWSDDERHFLYLCYVEFALTKAQTHELFGQVFATRLQPATNRQYTAQQLADQYQQRKRKEKPWQLWEKICQDPGAQPLTPQELNMRDGLRDNIVDAAARVIGSNWATTNASGHLISILVPIILQPAAGSLAAAAIARAPAHIQVAVTQGVQVPAPAPAPAPTVPAASAINPVAVQAVVQAPLPTATVTAPAMATSSAPPTVQSTSITAGGNDQEDYESAFEGFLYQNQMSFGSENPYVPRMVHVKSLDGNDTTVRFKPGSAKTSSLVSEESQIYHLGGYVFPIRVDSNTPPELCSPGQATVAFMVCQFDVCSDCRRLDQEAVQDDVKLKREVSETGMPIVHRVHLARCSNGVWYFGGVQGAKMPKYLTLPPTHYRLRRVDFGVSEEKTTIVVVCKEGGCPECD